MILTVWFMPACVFHHAQPAQISVQVNNSLTQAVNLYVTVNGMDAFVSQVPASNSQTIPLHYAAGTVATLKAVTADGARTYSRPNITLTGTYKFDVP
jgi:hypothetical protein